MADTKYNERTPVRPVVDKPAKVREKGIARKLSDIFLSEHIDNVKKYIFSDVVIPAIKETIVSIVQNGVEMLFYGDSSIGKKTYKYSKDLGGTYVSYDGYSSGARNRAVEPRNSDRSWHTSRDVIFETRNQAADAKAELILRSKRYGSVSVAELCDMARVKPTYVEGDWGWFELEESDINIIGNNFRGYFLDMPKPIYIR